MDLKFVVAGDWVDFKCQIEFVDGRTALVSESSDSAIYELTFVNPDKQVLKKFRASIQDSFSSDDKGYCYAEFDVNQADVILNIGDIEHALEDTDGDFDDDEIELLTEGGVYVENYDDLPEIKSESRSLHIMRNISVSMIQANNGDPINIDNEETLERLLA